MSFVYDNATKSLATQQEMLDFSLDRFDNSHWLYDIPANKIRFQAVSNGPMYAYGISSQLVMDLEATKDTMDDGGTCMIVKTPAGNYPVRACALKSILERCGLKAEGYSRMMTYDPVKLQTILNLLFMSLSIKCLIKIADGKVSAIHSGRNGAYRVIDIPEVLQATADYFFTEYPLSTFESGYYSHEFVSATWRMAAYASTFFQSCQVLSKNSRFEPMVRVVTSDIGTDAVKIQPLIAMGNITIPLNSQIAVEHRGKNGIDAYKTSILMVLDHFKRGAETLEKLKLVEIRNGYNTLLRVMDKFNFPKEQGLEAADMYRQINGDDTTLAYELFMYLCHGLSLVQVAEPGDTKKLFRLQDTVSRTLNLPWKKFDLPGSYAW